MECLNPLTVVQLENLDLARFFGLCGYMAKLSTPGQSQLGDLSSGMTFLKGLTISIEINGSPVEGLPAGAQVTVSFVVPPEAEAKTLSILSWDPAANNGAGGWLEVPVVVTNGRAEATFDHAGTFVLVMK